VSIKKPWEVDGEDGWDNLGNFYDWFVNELSNEDNRDDIYDKVSDLPTTILSAMNSFEIFINAQHLKRRECMLKKELEKENKRLESLNLELREALKSTQDSYSEAARDRNNLKTDNYNNGELIGQLTAEVNKTSVELNQERRLVKNLKIKALEKETSNRVQLEIAKNLISDIINERIS